MTNEDDWVLDPFLGSGTSLIASLLHKRKCAGAEVNKEYIQIAYERIKKLKDGLLKTRKMNTPIYDPQNPQKTIMWHHKNNQINLFNNHKSYQKKTKHANI